jgi:hypothetical protein
VLDSQSLEIAPHDGAVGYTDEDFAQQAASAVQR